MTIERGDGWTMYLGDCLEVMPTLERVDAVVTDPPYGVDLGNTSGRWATPGLRAGLRIDAYASYEDSYENFVGTIVPRLNTALDAADRGLVWTGPHVHEQRKPDAMGGVYYPAGGGRHAWGFKQFLPVLLYGVSPSLARGLGAACPTAIQSGEQPEQASREHPVPKPVGWMLWSVRLASLPAETILDPFAGSGTTGVACLRLGRRFIGIEKDPKYFALAVERLRAEENGSTLQASRAGQLPLLGGVK